MKCLNGSNATLRQLLRCRKPAAQLPGCSTSGGRPSSQLRAMSGSRSATSYRLLGDCWLPAGQREVVNVGGVGGLGNVPVHLVVDGDAVPIWGHRVGWVGFVETGG